MNNRYSNSRRKRRTARIIIILICAAVFIYCAVRLIVYFVDSAKVKRQEAELREMYESAADAVETTEVSEATPAPEIYDAVEAIVKPEAFWKTEGEILPELTEIRAKNEDLAGWIRIPDVVSTAVVYYDNEYYLTHDIYQRESASGTVFIDVNSPIAPKTQNVTMYGHNMKDGTMFGHLEEYLKEDFFRDNRFFRFSTLYQQDYYVIFAVMCLPGDPANPNFVAFNAHPTFSTTAEFEEYMDVLRVRSMYDWDIDVNEADTFITLSTCLNENRLVLVARRRRNGEDASNIYD